MVGWRSGTPAAEGAAARLRELAGIPEDWDVLACAAARATAARYLCMAARRARRWGGRSRAEVRKGFPFLRNVMVM